MLPVLLLGLLSACGGDGTAPTASDEFPDLAADNVSFDVRFFLTHNGIRKALVTADTMYLYQGESRTDLRNVDAVFFDESGEESGRLTARDGVYDMAAERFTAIGDAVLDIEVEGQTRQIESEELNYAISEERLWSTMETRMRVDGRVITGSSFESDVDFENPRIADGRTVSEREIGRAPEVLPDEPGEEISD